MEKKKKRGNSSLRLQKSSSTNKFLHIQLDNNRQNRSFTILKEIGKGSFGAVSQIYSIDDKSVYIGKLIYPYLITEQSKTQIQKNLSNLEKITSVHAIRYRKSIEYEGSLMLITDFQEKGSFRDIMDLTAKVFSEDQISIIIRDLLIAIHDIHDKYQLTHQDIKASNLLFDSEGHIKICDYGIAQIFNENTPENIAIIGTPFWAAPEYLSDNTFTFSSDIWSIGITAFELSEGSPPYTELIPSNAILNIATKGFPGFRFPNCHSLEFIDFLSHCLEFDPKKRWKPQELLKHPFIQKAEGLKRKTVFRDIFKIEIPRLVIDSKFAQKKFASPNHDSTHKMNPFLENESLTIPPMNLFYSESEMNMNSFRLHFRDFTNESSESTISNSNSDLWLDSNNSDARYFGFIDHKSKLNDDERLDLQRFVANGRKMSSQIKFVPFKIVSTQSPENSVIYAWNDECPANSKQSIFQTNGLLTIHQVAKLAGLFLFFIPFVKFDFRGVLYLSIFLLFVYFIHFIFSKMK